MPEQLRYMPEQTKSKQVGVRFTSGDLTYLQGKAGEWQLSLSETIRRMIFAYRNYGVTSRQEDSSGTTSF